MVQPKYSPEEALQRMKLLMKYDTSSTLTENTNKLKPNLNEALFAIPWLVKAFTVGASAVGLTNWISNLVSGSADAFTKTKGFFQGCNTEYVKLKPTQSSAEHAQAANAIYDAVTRKGFLGIGQDTDESAIKQALSSMTTVADLCAMAKKYTIHGDLYEDLDGDLDGAEFRDVVWKNIAPQIMQAQEDLEKAGAEPVTGDDKKDGSKKTGTGGSKWRTDCTTYTVGCKTDRNGPIGQVQKCIGATQDGLFGKRTLEKLKEKGYTSFTDADVNKICSKTTTKPTSDEEDVDVKSADQI